MTAAPLALDGTLRQAQGAGVLTMQEACALDSLEADGPVPEWLYGIVSLLFVAAFTWRAYMKAEDGVGPQSRRESIIEAWTNIAIGFSINYCANLVLLPLVDAHLTATSNFWLGWIYTAVSIVRQFVIRRWFNTQSFSAWLVGVVERE